MPRKAQFVVCVYQVGAPEAIVGVGGFWRMCLGAAALVWRARWHLYARHDDSLPRPLGDMLNHLMDTIESPKVMH